MGRRRDKAQNEDGDVSHKRSKHKHKKHKKKRERSSSASEEIDVVGIADGRGKDEGKSLIKLKIKLGGQTLSTAEVIPLDSQRVTDKITVEEEEEVEESFDADADEDYYQDEEPVTDPSSFEQNFKPIENDTNSIDSSFTQEDDVDSSIVDIKDSNDTNDIDEDDEEEKWLDALEKGELEEYTPPSKRKKDISLMTARQRALYGHNIEGETELLELPIWSKRRDDDSEEAQTRRKQRAKKRKQQMQKQIEDSKVQTINKLLNKQAAKNKRDEKSSKVHEGRPHVRYINNANGVFLCYTEGLEYPLDIKKDHKILKPVQCAAKGCRNIKKYSCSKSMLPVCSLSCYKKVEVM